MRSRLLTAALLLALPLAARAQERLPAPACSSRPQVTMEFRILHVPQMAFERVGIDFDAPTPCPNCPGQGSPAVRVQKTPTAPKTPAICDEPQVAQFLEALQGDPRARCYSTPRITLPSGEMGYIQLGDKPVCVPCPAGEEDGEACAEGPRCKTVVPGLKITVLPSVSGRVVRMRLRVEDTQKTEGETPAVNVQTIEQTVEVPSGQTVILGGLKKVCETRTECCPPVLSKVPYVNRLFKNVAIGREPFDVLVFVTPRVGCSEEGACVPPARCAPATVKDAPRHRFAETTGRCEEAEAGCATKACCEGECRMTKALTELLAAYEAACAEGRTAEAERLARVALILDPTCFRKVRR